MALLQRSSTLQNREADKEFTQQDLLDIAADVGIDSRLVQKVVDEHFQKRSELEVIPRPFDTKLQLTTTPSSFTLKIPPLGIGGGSLFGIVFSIVWIGFVAFWTFLAAKGSLLFALFSLPFWVVGLGMIRSHIRKHLSTTTLLLDREGGTLTQSPFGKQHKLRTAELGTAVVTQTQKHRSKNSGNNWTTTMQVLQLQHGVGSHDLLEGYSDREQRWVESELRAWLM